MNTYDAVVLGVCAWGIWRGWNRGVYKSVAIVLALGVALGASWLWATPVADYARAHTAIDEEIRSLLVTKTGLDFIAQHIDAIRSWWRVTNPSHEGEPLLTLAEQATTFVLVSLCAIAVFVGAWIVARTLFAIIAAAFGRIPVLHTVNHFGGGIAGGVSALTVALVISAILQLFLDDTGHWGHLMHTSKTVQDVLPMLGLGWRRVVHEAHTWSVIALLWKG